MRFYLMRSFCLTLLFIGVVSSSFAQLNSYKYIIVPKKFDVFSEENLWQTSVLVKYLFEDAGYNTIYDDELPPDLVNQRCLGLKVDLEKKSSLTWTKMTIVLKDCSSVEIFRSPEGGSKSKDFREAYHESIREAFQIFETINYSYQPAEEEPVTVNFGNDIRSVEEESRGNVAKEAAVVQVATPDEQSYEDLRPEPSEYVKADPKEAEAAVSMPEVDTKDLLIAKESANGYELLDSNSDLKVTLYKTSAPDVFLAKYGNVDGMVYKKDSKWILEYYKNKELVAEELNIKF